MNILLTILLIIAILIALLLVIPLFVKKDYFIEKEILINAPTQKVFDYIKHIKNQDNYSKWVMTDPSMKKEFRGTDGREGFVYAWDSQNKNAGKGEQEIVKIKEGERIDIEIRFERPFAGVANAPMITEPAGEQTRVKWGMLGRSKYPMNITNLFLDKMLGKDIEASLGNLKTIMESR
jgi:uncharacterized protein YndB with AHSA1/START domain